MLRSAGLYGYIQNNNIKSGVLLAGFVGVMQLIVAAITCWLMLYLGGHQDFAAFISKFLNVIKAEFLPVLVGSLVWVAIAFSQFKKNMRTATGLHPTERRQEMRLYNIVENLSISVGLPTPDIEISESPALNAFAMGISPSSSTIGVTRGLMNSLNDQELQAVIAHELTHIRSHDVRLVTLATIFCGMIFSFGWYVTYRIREAVLNLKTNGLRPMLMLRLALILLFSLPIMMIMLQQFQFYVLGLSFILVFLAVAAGLALRMMISRTREYVADAGAVELTKNPEALISALIKIEGRSLIDNGDVMLRAMMISAPASGLSSTHPSIENRINAIVFYAAHNLKGLKLLPAEHRAIPFTDEQGLAAGFSIRKMKYPAWISKPSIVVPSLLSAGLTYLVTQNMLLDVIMATPHWISEFWSAPRSQVVVYNHDNPLPENQGPFSLFTMSDIKATLMTGLVGLPLVYGLRHLVKSGYLKDSDEIRKMMGRPSKLMEADWGDVSMPPIKPAPPQSFSTTSAQAPVFGRAMSQSAVIERERAAFRNSLETSRAENPSGLKGFTRAIPPRLLMMGIAVPFALLTQFSGLFSGGSAFVYVAPANDSFSVRKEVQTFLLAKVTNNRQKVGEAIQKAAYKCAADLSPTTPAGKKFGSYWAQVYGGVAYITTFGGDHFPTEEEIQASFKANLGNGNSVTPEGGDHIEGSGEFFQNYWDKGLVGLSVRNDCIFEGASDRLGGPADIKGSL